MTRFASIFNKFCTYKKTCILLKRHSLINPALTAGLETRILYVGSLVMKTTLKRSLKNSIESLKNHIGYLFHYYFCNFRDPTYLKIVQRFEERKQAPYSIHQVALMGACEGKEVGQWFGPNTVAQVLK